MVQKARDARCRRTTSSGRSSAAPASSKASPTRTSPTRATPPTASRSSWRRSPTTATAPAPRSRTSSRRNGGSLAEPGAVAWQFERKGVILVPKAAASEDDLMLAALDAGAEDIEDQGDTWQVTTAPTDLHAVRTALDGAGITVTSADLTMLPTTTIALERRGEREVGVAGDRRARGARRRAERVRELRHPRRRPPVGVRLRSRGGSRRGACLHP